MAVEEGLFPIDTAELVGGAAMVVIREVYDPSTGDKRTVPNRFEDIFNPFGPLYEINEAAGWWPVGAAREGQGSTYGRNIEAQDWNVEQRQQAIAVDITDVPRTMGLQIAEVTAKHVKLFENAVAVEDLGAPTSGQVGQERVRAGSIDSLERYQIAMFGLRRIGEGADVIEIAPGNVKTQRGRFVGTVLHQGSLARENVEYELQKGQMVNIPVGFTAHPDQDMEHKKETVTWLFEKPGQAFKGTTYP